MAGMILLFRKSEGEKEVGPKSPISQNKTCFYNPKLRLGHTKVGLS